MNKMERRAFLKTIGGLAGGVCLTGAFGNASAGDVASGETGAPTCHVLEGPFGLVEINLKQPALSLLYLRQSNGRLGLKSILSEHASDFPRWAVGAASYLVDQQGRRFEARLSTEHRWRSDAATQTLHIANIRPRALDGTGLACVEDWNLSITHNGGLRWEIHRRFERSFNAACHGGPALFFNISPNTGLTRSTQSRLNPSGNAVAVNWWVEQEKLFGEPVALYERQHAGQRFFPKNKSVTMREKDGWAIFKLFTAFPNDQDLRVEAKGGHLYRRGMFWAFAEVGLTAGPTASHTFKKGDKSYLILNLCPEQQSTTGQQLMVSLPDKTMEASLKGYFGGLANAGCLADCEKHLLGNECDGYLYAGNMWMHAYALLASVGAAGPISSRPVSYADAVRKTLEYNLDSVNEKGQVTAGFTHGGEFPELPMMNIIALEAYLLYSANTDFARRCMPAVERVEQYLLTWLKDGLFHASTDRLKMPTGSINWYYDELRGAHGYTMYHNVNYACTLRSLATIYTALGKLNEAKQYVRRRRQLVRNMNRRFWVPNAYGREKDGYVDWIREDGAKGTYFFACNQYRAILHGIAGPEQARRLLVTADLRISELKKYYNYTREGTLDNLWPLKTGEIQLRHLRFGALMDGGMLLCMTFWEVAARCRVGDADGAYRLLKNFSEHAGRTNWFEGVNAFSMDGKPTGWEGDPFLADQLVAAAGVIHGFLGLDYSWDNFTVTPHLPSSWDRMSATIMFKGIRYTILATSSGRVQINKVS